ncbi:ABC transporter permease [Lentilactobacillus hilgardii]|uniref:ABC transporter, permease protein n=1 Tax=Lentilactobacillus hilgardii (strain ATCC 8290 / DSM 20176 / CCUG 30140 / JCM 1155 / KCTC 3500 / NBRC 15886 / NCIMB 8040 / NRRL B-1843 / 9) TaxID=1423757 RepID=C0XHN9_LENH9|nr:proline/glycine betaine ABC transporter permease [Lentilactobacillus hilgardii]EEI19225.1 ABC transporter, permease protein [Lentilactobacillus buchneri ATCC 11577]EEI25171.1 ABC transporter, permease protein [Lentilactobacillus hilgardii DSM 20176 = ATCC 8290]KRK59334.1 glycine betaine carnitine ABC superfamily ATP binding cassette transporter [Lentilactobacillus hilgardii DSM 20176 = ATCC 8290]MCP9333025.1 proline/glycine betaine ABC transporter permease [Lentilactobacillus hilgardii]MCP9
MTNIPQLPVSDWINHFVNWLEGFTGFFNGITNFIGGIINGFQWIFDLIPIWLFIVLVVGGTYWLNRKTKHWTLIGFEVIGLLYVWNQGYWRDMTQTLTLVLTSSLIALVIGVPIGIWMAKSKVVEIIVKPILDFMQTMPAFVYLIPAVAFFGIGMVPGVIASVIFAMPPTIRMTNLGIRQVPEDLIEAADSYGSTSWQKLVKVQLPLAKSTLMAGVNQSMMLSLSMVVIASMIGAMGLGNKVYFAVGRNDAGSGFAAGLAIVILAIILDRITQAINRSKSPKA